MGGVEQVLLAAHARRLVGERQPREPQHLVLDEVVLDEAVEEGDLEVDLRSSGGSAIGRTAELMSG